MSSAVVSEKLAKANDTLTISCEPAIVAPLSLFYSAPTAGARNYNAVFYFSNRRPQNSASTAEQ